MKSIRYADVENIKNRLKSETVPSGDYLYDYKIEDLKSSISLHNPQ